MRLKRYLKWQSKNCPCRLCKQYVSNLDFITKTSETCFYYLCYFQRIWGYCSLPILPGKIANLCLVKYSVRMGWGHFAWSGLTIFFYSKFRSSHPKICSVFTGDYPCRSVISIMLLCSLQLGTPMDGCFWKF